MSRLNGQDGSSGGQVSWVGDVGCCSEVCSDSDTLEHLGESQETTWVCVWELVLACGDWSSACGLESRGQEVDVGGLIEGDLLEVRVECSVESGCGEVGCRVLGKTLLVEGGLEVLESQGEVKDDGINVRLGLSLLDW